MGRNLGMTNLNDTIEVTVRLRRKASIEEYVKDMEKGKNNPLSQDEFEQRFGASEKDIDLVEQFAHDHDLTVVDSSVPRRRLSSGAQCRIFAGIRRFPVKLSIYRRQDFSGQDGGYKDPRQTAAGSRRRFWT